MKNLRLTTLNFDTINILSPILSKIESSTKQVSRKEFIKKCNKLYEKLNPKQREIILKNKKYKFVKEKRESFDFEPKNYHKECKLKESKVFLILSSNIIFLSLLFRKLKIYCKSFTLEKAFQKDYMNYIKKGEISYLA